MSFRLAAYAVCIEDGRVLLARVVSPTGDWTAVPDLAGLDRSSLIDVGLALARTRPATGHVAPVAVGGRIRH